MRRVMPWLNGVSTTQGTSCFSAFTSRATAKASLSALPGIQMTKSMSVFSNTPCASSVVETCVNDGG